MDARVVAHLQHEQLSALVTLPHRVDAGDGGALQPHGHQRFPHLLISVVLKRDTSFSRSIPARGQGQHQQSPAKHRRRHHSGLSKHSTLLSLHVFLFCLSYHCCPFFFSFQSVSFFLFFCVVPRMEPQNWCVSASPDYLFSRGDAREIGRAVWSCWKLKITHEKWVNAHGATPAGAWLT